MLKKIYLLIIHVVHEVFTKINFLHKNHQVIISNAITD